MQVGLSLCSPSVMKATTKQRISSGRTTTTACEAAWNDFGPQHDGTQLLRLNSQSFGRGDRATVTKRRAHPDAVNKDDPGEQARAMPPAHDDIHALGATWATRLPRVNGARFPFRETLTHNEPAGRCATEAWFGRGRVDAPQVSDPSPPEMLAVRRACRPFLLVNSLPTVGSGRYHAAESLE